MSIEYRQFSGLLSSVAILVLLVGAGCSDSKSSKSPDAVVTTPNPSDANPPAALTELIAVPAFNSVNLTWTNPADSDLQGVLVLRQAQSAVTDVPVDGTAYQPGTAIGTAQVVSNGGAPSFNDTGLSGTIPYHYLLFAFDGSYNYAPGVAANGVPPYNPNLGTWTTSSIGGGDANLIDGDYAYTLTGSVGATSVTYYTIDPSTKIISGGTATSSFSTNRANFSSAVNGGYVYVLGGSSSAPTTCSCTGFCTPPPGSIFSSNGKADFAPVNPDGSLGTFQATTNAATGTLHPAVVVYNNFIYMIGGRGFSNNTCTGFRIEVSSTLVQFAPINVDGSLGTWATTTVLPAGIDAPTVRVANGRLYLFGGFNNNFQQSSSSTLPSVNTLTYYSAVYWAPINVDGTLGAWTATTSPPYGGFYNAGSAFRNGYMYIYGGGAFPVGGGAVLPTTSAFYALVNDNGSLGTWNPTASMPDVATGFGTNSVLRNNEILVPHGAYLSWSQFMD